MNFLSSVLLIIWYIVGIYTVYLKIGYMVILLAVLAPPALILVAAIHYPIYAVISILIITIKLYKE